MPVVDARDTDIMPPIKEESDDFGPTMRPGPGQQPKANIVRAQNSPTPTGTPQSRYCLRLWPCGGAPPWRSTTAGRGSASGSARPLTQTRALPGGGSAAGKATSCVSQRRPTEMRQGRLEGDVISSNAVISACKRSKQWERACDMFSGMLEEQV